MYYYYIKEYQYISMCLYKFEVVRTSAKVDHVTSHICFAWNAIHRQSICRFLLRNHFFHSLFQYAYYVHFI